MFRRRFFAFSKCLRRELRFYNGIVHHCAFCIVFVVVDDVVVVFIGVFSLKNKSYVALL